MPTFRIGDLVQHSGTRGDGYPSGMVGRVECFYNRLGVFRTTDPVTLEGQEEVGVFFQDMYAMNRGHDLDGTANFEYGGWWCTLHNIVLVEPRPPRVWPPTESHKVRYSNMETEYV